MIREIQFAGKKIIFNEQDDADSSVAAEIFELREYRSAEDVIKTAGVIVDIGAHIGLFTLYCRALNPSTKIFALEPEPNNFSRLAGNLAINATNGNILPLPLALSAKSGIRHLLIAVDSHNHRLKHEDEPGETIEVKSVSLGVLIKRENIGAIDLIKMDIEGGEYEVMENLSTDDWGHIKNIILEYHEGKKDGRKILEKILRENGFTAQTYPSRFCKRLGFIWARNKKMKKYGK